MMNQFTDTAMNMYDQDNEMDKEMELLQAEVQQEKLSGLANPEKAAAVEQVQEKKPVAENNLEDLL